MIESQEDAEPKQRVREDRKNLIGRYERERRKIWGREIEMKRKSKGEDK